MIDPAPFLIELTGRQQLIAADPHRLHGFAPWTKRHCLSRPCVMCQFIDIRGFLLFDYQ